MARRKATELAQLLSQQAEAVCRRYLSEGRRSGDYWLVGDVRNTPGRSMFVRLRHSAKGPAGRWTDSASGEYGDLLDVIRHARGLSKFTDVLDEARAFLGIVESPASKPESDHYDLVAGSRKLFSMSRQLQGSIAERYLRQRGFFDLGQTAALRFHPRCIYRIDNSPPTTWPALVAAVTDLNGQITGVQRTYLARDGSGKAPLDPPRKAMGDLLGHAVRFGDHGDLMIAGEGIETVMSLRQALPGLSALSALSAAHLSAVLLPKTLRRLYIARDNDPSGERACARLIERAHAEGFEAIPLIPKLGDFNDDLLAFGLDALRANVLAQFDQKVYLP